MITSKLSKLQNQHHTDNTDKLNAYAAPLVHDKCFDICKIFIDGHEKSKNLKVLILGAGSGYFDQRLLDYGVKNIDAIEYIPEHYKVKNTTLYSIDLNQPWAEKLLDYKYDLIIAIEVIEHLENQFLLMREISSLLSESSMLLLTSPNVNSSFSRFRFLLTGYLEYFGHVELNSTGHIVPILDHIFEMNLNLADLKIINKDSNRNIWHARIDESKHVKKIFIYLLYMISKITIYKKEKEGEINIYSILKIKK